MAGNYAHAQYLGWSWHAVVYMYIYIMLHVLVYYSCLIKFNIYIYRIPGVIMAEQDVFQCPMEGCSFISSTPVEWLAHLRSIDHHQPFNVRCCIEGCDESAFKTFSGLKSHIY